MQADASISCTRTCGVLSSMLGLSLAAYGTIALERESIRLSDASNSSSAAPKAAAVWGGSAASSLAINRLCSHICKPGKGQKTFAAPGVAYVLEGKYEHSVADDDGVQAFKAHVAAHAAAAAAAESGDK